MRSRTPPRMVPNAFLRWRERLLVAKSDSGQKTGRKLELNVRGGGGGEGGEGEGDALGVTVDNNGDGLQAKG